MLIDLYFVDGGYGKSIKRNLTDEQFNTLLLSAKPALETLNLLSVIMRDIYADKLKKLTSNTRKIENELEALKKDRNNLVKQITRTADDTLRDIYEDELRTVEERRQSLQSDL